MSKAYEKLLLLLYKNLMIRLSNLGTSLFEFFLPILIAFIAGCVISNSKPNPLPPKAPLLDNCWDYGQPSKVPTPLGKHTIEYLCPKLYRFPSLEAMRYRPVLYAILMDPKDSKYANVRKLMDKTVNGPYQLSEMDINETLEGFKTTTPPPDATVVQATLRGRMGVYESKRQNHSWAEFDPDGNSSEKVKKLERCLLKLENGTPSCDQVFAAVIITNLDKINNKYVYEYTIRMPQRYATATIKDDAPPSQADAHEAEEQYVGSTLCAGVDREWDKLPAMCRSNSGSLFNANDTSAGFIHLQAYIDRGLREYIKELEGKAGGDIHDYRLSLVRMPYLNSSLHSSVSDDRELRDKTINNWGVITSAIITLFFALPIFSAMRVNSERSSGFKEFLRMHGVSSWLQWMAWLLSCVVVHFFWTILIALCLVTPFGEWENLNSKNDFDGFLFWLLLFLFAISVTTFSFFLSVFFQKVWTAITMGLVAWVIMTSLMFVASLSLFTLTRIATLGYMFMPPSAYHFGYAMMITGGGKFDTMFEQKNPEVDITLMASYGMLILDSILYMTLAIYMDNVIPSTHGVAKSPLYIFHKSEWSCLANLKKSDAQDKDVQVMATPSKVPALTGAPQPSERTSVDTNVNVPVDHVQQDQTEAESSKAKVPEDDNDSDTSLPPEGVPDSAFEADPKRLVPVVILEDMKKSFGPKKMAVNGLTGKMFQGEIYALLGHNGAGKTTTMSILTGLMKPTSGTAKILGMDIGTQMDEIRKHIGLCPQHNLLFDEMTVKEHVVFFGMLKGLKHKQAVHKALELLSWLDLSKKLKKRPQELSGGQKRRVHLAIALIGETKLAFLDEPSSGLDPETRREVWAVLLQLRGKLSLIMTTHHLEEADVLGDRIGIMSSGKMVCAGTSSYLKKYYGTGYDLKMSRTPTCNQQEVNSLVEKYVPNAVHETPEPGSSTLSTSLPIVGLDMLKLADLMQALQEKRETLGVDNIGLSLATMDEVFIKAGETDPEHHEQTVSKPSSPTKHSEVKLQKNIIFLWTGQFVACFLKRLISFVRAPIGHILLMVFLSITYYVCAISLALNDNLDPIKYKKAEPPINMSRNHYNLSSSVSLQYKDASTEPAFVGLIDNYNTLLHTAPTKFDNVVDFLNGFEKKLLNKSTQQVYKDKYVIGSAFFRDNTVKNPHGFTTLIHGYFSKYAVHSAPLSMNLISRALILQETGMEADIRMTNHPYRHPQTFWKGEYHLKEPEHNLLVAIALALLTVVIMSVLTSMATLLPIEEKLNTGKHLQLMTGTPPAIYWIGTFMWDFLLLSMVNILLLIWLVIADAYSGRWLYTDFKAGGTFFCIMECFVFCSLWFCYFVTCTKWIKAPSSGFLIVNLIYLIIGILITSACVIFAGIFHFFQRTEEAHKPLFKITDGMRYIFWVIPPANLFQAIYKLFVTSIANQECSWPETVDNLVSEICTKSANPNISNPKIHFIKKCCKNCKEILNENDIANNKKCFEPYSFWGKKTVSSWGFFPVDLNYYYEPHGIRYDMLAMICTGIFYAIVLTIMEYRTHYRALFHACKNRNKAVAFSSPRNIADEDVLGERKRIEKLLDEGKDAIKSEVLAVYNLKQQFKDFTAVNDLAFGVHYGECFGLLGVNGAGKTTTFKMLTGELFPTTGVMHVGGYNYYKDRTAFMCSMGYCPQFDGIIPILTGREMIMLFGALRGIPLGKLKAETTMWLEKFGLLENAWNHCGNYSGGMKRRLSAAMALIGNPKICLLDEPTAGVDPVSRRQFWDVIREVRENGQSIILTSHTMDECEALCNRLVIMVNGQFQCLGDVQHLKSKFGEGYTLEVKLKRLRQKDNPEQQFETLNARIITEFSPCTMKDRHDTTVEYRIQNASLWYSDIFRSMEAIKKKYGIILEYSVVESSLEDIFISFARQQSGPNLMPKMGQLPSAMTVATTGGSAYPTTPYPFPNPIQSGGRLIPGSISEPSFRHT